MKMKLVGITSAVISVEAVSQDALYKDDYCAGKESKCASGLCCGIAEEIVENGSEDTAAKLTICNYQEATEWIDTDDPDLTYTFRCGDGNGAAKLIAIAASLLSAIYLII